MTEVIQAGRIGTRWQLKADTTELLSRSGSRAGELQRACLAILLEHQRDGGLPTSNRFVFYELEHRGIVQKQKPGEPRADQPVTNAIKYLRDVGVVPWDWIVDETRALHNYTGWSSVLAGTRWAVSYDVRLDPWDDEPAPLILTESRSLAGVLRDLAHEYRCQLAATNGQVGGFLVTDIAPELTGNDGRVLYLGDFDLSGGHIEDNTRRVLEEHTDRDFRDEGTWERLAITAEQVHDNNLPVIRKVDGRHRKSRRPCCTQRTNPGHDAVETEALRQQVIVSIVRDRLDELLPEPLADVVEREQRQRDRVTAALANLEDEQEES